MLTSVETTHPYARYSDTHDRQETGHVKMLDREIQPSLTMPDSQTRHLPHLPRAGSTRETGRRIVGGRKEGRFQAERRRGGAREESGKSGAADGRAGGPVVNTRGRVAKPMAGAGLDGKRTGCSAATGGAIWATA